MKVFYFKMGCLIFCLSLLSSLSNATTTQYQFVTSSGFSFQNSTQSQELETLMGGADYLNGLSSSGTFSYVTPDSAEFIIKDTETEFIYYSPSINVDVDFNGRNFSAADGAVGAINAVEVAPGFWLKIMFLDVYAPESFGYFFGNYQLTGISFDKVYVAPLTGEPAPSEINAFPLSGINIHYNFSGPDDLNHNLTASIAITDVRVSAVPVPAAAWLFGSALIGLFGLNRKNQLLNK
jgi:hypothetical protein